MAMVTYAKVSGICKLMYRSYLRKGQENLGVRFVHRRRVIEHNYAVYIRNGEWYSSILQSIDDPFACHVRVCESKFLLESGDYPPECGYSGSFPPLSDQLPGKVVMEVC